MSRMLLIILAVIVLVYLGLCTGLFIFQRSLIYFPQAGSVSADATIILPVAGERVLVSTRPNDGPGAVIYFGGNSEDVSSTVPGLATAFPGHAIYLLHYRGFG